MGGLTTLEDVAAVHSKIEEKYKSAANSNSEDKES